MSNEKKYYTPNIEEFRVGFRYEILNIFGELKNGELIETDRVWIKEVCSLDYPSATLPMIDRLIKEHPEDIRVKVLDESDIVELGWELNIYGGMAWSNRLVSYKIKTHRLNYDEFIKEIFIQNYTENISTIFLGTIRNYNELKDVMRMLEICVG